jgi:hypothetical protein
MEMGPSWETALPSLIQKFPNIWWNPNVHHHVYKSPPLVPVLSQINSGHKTPSHCNGFDQRVAGQQLCKHGPTWNNRGSCVFCRSTDAPIDRLDSDHVIYVYCRFVSVPRLYKWAEFLSWSSSGRSTRTRKQVGSSRSIEEYKKSAPEDLPYNLMTLCVL